MQHIQQQQKQQQAQAIEQFLKQFGDKVTHYVVAHTNIWSNDRIDKKYESLYSFDKAMKRKVEQAQIACTRFRSHLNDALYGRNAVKRKPQLCRPLLIATLEGSLLRTNEQKTLHYNFLIGNLPDSYSDEQFESVFRDCWINKAEQRDDICFRNVRHDASAATAYIGYSLKEMQAGNAEAWDVLNTQIPYKAFNAD